MHRTLIVLACLPIAVPLAAQDPRLTLPEVYASLEGASPRIRAANAQAEAARARVGPASRWPDPSIQFALMNRNLPGLGLQDPLGMNQIQVMQMIPLAGKVGLSVKAARADARADAARAREVSWEVRARAAMIFYDLYAADHALVAMEQSRRLLQEVVATAGAMYTGGRGRQTDVLRGQVELARMEEEIIRMRGMRDAMAVRLNTLRGLPSDTPVPLLVLPGFPKVTPGRQELEELALRQRPMLAAGAARIEASTALATRATREIWPDLTVGVIYGQRPMPDGSTERMGSFMLGFTLPLSAGSRQGQMEVEARSMRAMAVADLDDMRSETRGRIGELHADLLRARALTVLYQTTLLPQIRATTASALASYQGGSGDFMTVLESQMNALRAAQDLARFDSETGKAFAELEMLTATVLLDLAAAPELPGGAP